MMNEAYYKSVKTGAIVRAGKIEADFYDIFGPVDARDTVSWCHKLEESGAIEPVKDPTVIDFLKQDDRIGAVVRYRELHNDCPLGVAYSMVNKIAEDLKAFKKK